MLKYISSRSYRHQYQLLNRFEFFSSKFYNISLTALKGDLVVVLGKVEGWGKTVKSLLDILSCHSKTAESRVKMLWIIHVLIQITPRQHLPIIEQHLIFYINQVIKNCSEETHCETLPDIKSLGEGHKYSSCMKTEDSTPTNKREDIPKFYPIDFQLIEVPSPLLSNCSPSPTLKMSVTGASLSSSKEIDQNLVSSNQLKSSRSSISIISNSSRSSESSSKPVHNKQQFFDFRLTLPYSSFLLKLIQWKGSNSDIRDEVECWTLINLYKSMLKVTACFSSIASYFKDPLLCLLLLTSELFHVSIMETYWMIEKYLKERLQGLDKWFKEVMQEQSEAKKAVKLDQIINNYELDSFREIFSQLALINEQIFVLYRNKYTREILTERKITMLKLVDTEEGLGELVHSILNMRCKLEQKITKRHILRVEHTGSLPSFIKKPSSSTSTNLTKSSSGV